MGFDADSESESGRREVALALAIGRREAALALVLDLRHQTSSDDDKWIFIRKTAGSKTLVLKIK